VRGDGRTLSMRMLLVAPPTRNTAYSISCTGPVRAPTIRSVPLTACEKLARTSVRSRSRPSSSAVASAIDSTTSASVQAAVPGAARSDVPAAPSAAPPG
jgi:NAD kinase